MRIRSFSAFFLILIVFPACADLPLTIENLLTDKGKIKPDLGLSYANINRHGISGGEPIVIQTGAASYLKLDNN